MKEFSVCYDRFCLGNYTLVCDGSDTVQATADLGAFEMYVLGMWNDGLVVTMKAYDEVRGENQFVLLVPDGSEQLMSFSPGRGFVVRPYRAARQGRFAYLLDFLCGLKYKGYQGYEEYDEEEKILDTAEIRKQVNTTDEIENELLEIIERLKNGGMRLNDSMNMKYSDMVDYYTMWVHQIKTPIASMHLILQKEDSEDSRRLRAELFRVEQYVQMVLCFLRLDLDFTDYVIKEYRVDDIIRPAVRRLAPQFIMKKLSLEYEQTDEVALTDEKWLSFVVEQVLSNAVKYTSAGSISIKCDGDRLVISDTGIGIAAEDLPRIFDKGYTGFNGRADRKASGIGLYLCRRICDNLGHSIKAESVPGHGTTIIIGLERDKLEVE